MAQLLGWLTDALSTAIMSPGTESLQAGGVQGRGRDPLGAEPGCFFSENPVQKLDLAFSPCKRI